MVAITQDRNGGWRCPRATLPAWRSPRSSPRTGPRFPKTGNSPTSGAVRHRRLSQRLHVRIRAGGHDLLEHDHRPRRIHEQHEHDDVLGVMSRHVGRVGAMNLFELWIGEGLPWRSGAVWGPAPQREGFRCPTLSMPTLSPRPGLARLIVEDKWSIPRTADRGDVPRRTVIDARSRVVCVKARDGQT